MIRKNVASVISRWHEPRRFIQVLSGPRQVGKTTVVRQALADCGLPGLYAVADEATTGDRSWLVQQWNAARLLARTGPAVLVVDEIQLIPDWSRTVKRLWDEDTSQSCPLQVCVLGSGSTLVRNGLDESLAGNFEVIPIRHWSQSEMFDGFGFDAEAFIFFGGYPGAASLRQDEDRWARYMRDAIIETTLGRDVLAMERIQKPALLRSVFHLACSHGGEILSYTKMQGQLQDAGNTVTLAHYLELLSRAGLVMGLSKHCGAEVRSRASSPKLLPLDTGLMSALAGRSFSTVRSDGEAWGRLAEVSVGAHLVRGLFGSGAEVKYWRDVNLEVDYVVTRAGRVTAIEVTTARRKGSLPGMTAFAKQFPVDRQLLVGGQGIPLAEFLSRPPEYWCA